MTKELFVSSTPHETKVGMVEDDQLAEVYLERENEYTLAGSIYKGRVTRVLPGMQSAFVDIGLERDAFLYVSDFMELENQDEDLDELPAPPTVQEFQPAQPVPAAALESRTENDAHPSAASQPPSTQQPAREERDRGGYRGRRRRGGHRERESRVSRPAQSESRPERESYGPPPAYQPIILPGESISKYRGLSQSPSRSEEPVLSVQQPEGALVEAFPQDEPLFATETAEGAAAEPGPTMWEQPPSAVQLDEPPQVAHFGTNEPALSDRPKRGSRMGVPVHSAQASEAAVDSDEWDRQQKRLHEMNVAAVFGGEEAVEDDRPSTETSAVSNEPAASALSTASGTVEEEEIDEEEADLASYVEDLEEDAAFDEFEEETHAAGEHTEPATEMAASAESSANVVPFSAEPVSVETAEAVQAAEELNDAAEDEAELEEAQAEAEALLDAEAIGTLEARAEVRAPAATAAYTQRARRQPSERDRGRRGFRRGGGGGRRFRRTEPQNLPLNTALLTEGQEILVQIAKEPIGKKGARITSHIALPGRFLVYMPTVHHNRGSRELASDA